MNSSPDSAGAGPHNGKVSVSFAVRTSRRHDLVRVEVLGELDIATAPALHRQLNSDALADARPLVLDLTAVSFIDSAGLRAVLDAVNRFASRLSIIPSAPCMRLFEIVGITDRLPLVEIEPPPAV